MKICRRAFSGSANSAAVSGQVVTFGRGTFAGLGRGVWKDSPDPQFVESLEREKIVNIASGWTSSFAVNNIGAVWKWGWRSELPHMLRLSRLRRNAPWLVGHIVHWRWVGRTLVFCGVYVYV